MKTLKNILKKSTLYLGACFLGLSLNSCSDDDDGTVVIPETNASISADAQIVSQNQIVIESVEVEGPAWVVVREVNDNGFSDIIGRSEVLAAGTHSNIVIELDNTDAADVNLEDGDSLVVLLHEDDGDGVFEFEEGTEGADPLLTDANGSGISDNFVITAPSISFSNQAVVDNTITVENVAIGQDAWIAVHNADEAGEFSEDQILGWEMVPANNDGSITITLDEAFVPTVGQNLYTRLYLDDPADQTFTYVTNPGDDLPVFFGFEEDGTVVGNIVLQ